jgi:hypothetical protein
MAEKKKSQVMNRKATAGAGVLVAAAVAVTIAVRLDTRHSTTTTARSAPHTPTTSPAASSIPASTQPAAPQTVPASAWLPVRQFPFESTYQWTETADEPTQSNLFSCPDGAIPASLSDAASQAQYYRPAPSSITQSASTQLLIFEFSSSSAAQAAFEEPKSDYGACDAGSHYAAGSRPPLKDSVTISALTDTGFASVHTFRAADGTEAGSPIGVASDTHEYFVQRGSLVEALRVNGDSYIDSSGTDIQTLNNLASCLG